MSVIRSVSFDVIGMVRESLAPRYTFRCRRPDHVDVFDEHVLKADYDALVREVERFRAVFEDITLRKGSEHG